MSKKVLLKAKVNSQERTNRFIKATKPMRLSHRVKYFYKHNL